MYFWNAFACVRWQEIWKRKKSNRMEWKIEFSSGHPRKVIPNLCCSHSRCRSSGPCELCEAYTQAKRQRTEHWNQSYFLVGCVTAADTTMWNNRKCRLRKESTAKSKAFVLHFTNVDTDVRKVKYLLT